METQKPIDYFKMFSDLVARSNELTRQRDGLDIEIAKIRQLIISTFALLPENKQQMFQKEISDMDEQSAGLMKGVKLVFSTHKGEWLTVSKVYGYLLQMGFDFRHYRANPLTSISTTLRRMVPTYLEMAVSSDGNVYTRRATLGDRIAGLITPPFPNPPVEDEIEDALREATKRPTLGQAIGNRGKKTL